MPTTTVQLVNITDLQGQVWADAVVNYMINGNGPFFLASGADLPHQYLKSQAITLDSTGSGSFTVEDSANIIPVNTLWKVTVNPHASAQGVTFIVKLTGASIDISSIINAGLSGLTIGSLQIPAAYSDTEIVGPYSDGQIYYNTGTNMGLRVFQSGVWTTVGGGGGGGDFSVTGSPSNHSNVPVYNGGSPDTAVWRQLTQADILPNFGITGFNGGQTVEIGTPIVNPAFTLSYTAPPDSAQITNTDGIDSPLTLTTPFTAGTVVGTFTKNTQASTTFTATAVKAGSPNGSAQQNLNWLPRNFAGVGSAGATGATASGNNATLTGATGTLNDAGIAASPVGQTFPVQNPNNQKIYILTIGAGHTFKDALTGFSMAFNAAKAVSFHNQRSVTVAMDLYETTNTLSQSFQPQCVS